MTAEPEKGRRRWATLRRSSDVECAFRQGERLRSDAMLIIFRPRDEGALRVAFLAAKSLGTAVRRNRQRRRLREAFGRLWPSMAVNPADLLLMALPSAESTGFGALVDTMACLLMRAGLLPRGGTPTR